MPIQIVKEKPRKRKIKPHYLLKYEYMIGDADGDTSKTVKVSADNPYLERYCKLLKKVKPVKGTWGICLDTETLEKWLNEKQITKDDYQFLQATMFDPDFGILTIDNTDENGEKNPYDLDKDRFLAEFYEGVDSETEYSFLVFEGLDLKYVDENGVKSKARVK